MKASPHPFVVEQDGEELTLKIKGDEHQHWVTDDKDYTVVRDDNGYYMYAELSLDNKRLLPTQDKVGRNAKKHPKSKNLRPDERISDEDRNDVIILDGGPAATTQRKSKWPKRCHRGGTGCGLRDTKHPAKEDDLGTIVFNTFDDHHRRMMTMPATGILKNLVVLLMFNDHQDRSVPSREDISVLMNSEIIDEDIAPTGSLKMIYWENSYGKLTIESEVTDWIILNNTESYYAGGASGLGSNRMFHRALREALSKLEDDGFNFEDFDQDADGPDGRIDSITFLTSGYGAEWGGQGFRDRIWSHKWSITGGWRSYSTGVLVTDYHVSPSLWGTSGQEIGRVGVIAHEIGHFLDLPDLYDTDGSGAGLGYFCLMANSWGVDAWSKMKLGWTEPQTPSIGGENYVALSERNATTEVPHQLYKIGDGQFGYPLGEYFLLEFRNTSGLEGGIAIYHIDESTDSYDREGYPGQVGDTMWPMNGNHYKIALAAADGMFELEKNINTGDSSDLYGMGQSLLPSKSMGGPFPNTDAYQGGRIVRTGLRICVTSDANGPYMTFLFSDGNPVQPWMTRVNENFEMEISEAISFGSNGTLVQHHICQGLSCAQIRNNDGAGMSVKVTITCLTELSVSFDFHSIGLKVGAELIVEYSVSGGADDAWVRLETWTRGADQPNGFRNRRWYSAVINLTLADVEVPITEGSYITLRMRTTANKRKLFLDNLKIEGKF
eukprot:jgi/Psemu1/69436/estExt_Genemark1.C_8530018